LGFCDTHAVAENPARPGILAGSPDGFHPDVPTYRRVGEAVADALERWMAKWD
jgi:lysophospholipase L1-like esterase